MEEKILFSVFKKLICWDHKIVFLKRTVERKTRYKILIMVTIKFIFQVKDTRVEGGDINNYFKTMATKQIGLRQTGKIVAQILIFFTRNKIDATNENVDLIKVMKP